MTRGGVGGRLVVGWTGWEAGVRVGGRRGGAGRGGATVWPGHYESTIPGGWWWSDRALLGLMRTNCTSDVTRAGPAAAPPPCTFHAARIRRSRATQVAVVRADRGAAAFPGQLVVLSERDRAELEAELLEALGPAAAAAVVTRQGSPLKVGGGPESWGVVNTSSN